MVRPGCACAVAIALFAALPALGASLKPVHPFANTGDSTPSEFALGASPAAELLQASDGNFYGTTEFGGTGLCENQGGTVVGCGTVFRMTPQGTVTVLHSFLYDNSSRTAPDGVYPRAGLIQGKDGYLYGVASDGGMPGCSGIGCGTLFRISTIGSFKLLHQFCGYQSCNNLVEGGQPIGHLVQLADKSLCGTTTQGGVANEGAIFCASTSGSVTTLYGFRYENGTDGFDPVTALLVGSDGKTLYGTTLFGGANGNGDGGGVVFAFRGSAMTILHAFDTSGSSAPGTYYQPEGALIFGADGKLYGTTYSGGSGGGCIFSLNTDGSAFAIHHDFNANASSNAPGYPAAGLVLARDGMMYGNTTSGSIEQSYGLDGGIAYRYDPVKGTFKALADFTGGVGSAPLAVMIEGLNDSLYGTTSLYGGSNKRGTDQGVVYRLAPPLKQ